jgi:hypothetical protein
LPGGVEISGSVSVRSFCETVFSSEEFGYLSNLHQYPSSGRLYEFLLGTADLLKDSGCCKIYKIPSTGTYRKKINRSYDDVTGMADGSSSNIYKLNSVRPIKNFATLKIT